MTFPLPPRSSVSRSSINYLTLDLDPKPRERQSALEHAALATPDPSDDVNIHSARCAQFATFRPPLYSYFPQQIHSSLWHHPFTTLRYKTSGPERDLFTLDHRFESGAVTMTATSQAFVASDILSTPGFFTAAIDADDNINPFEASFKAGTATLERGHDSYPRHHDHHTPAFTGLSNNTTLQSIKTDSYSPLFAFSPRMSPVPYGNDQFSSSKAVDVPAPARWGPCKQDNSLQLDLQSAVQLQALSPPNSVKHSPDRRQFNDLPQPIYSQLHRILTHSPHGRTRAEYGQVTPPNDRSPEDGDRHRDEHDEQFMESGRASKRKRGSPSSQPAEVADKNPSKRPRKSVAHSNPQFFGASETSAPPVEDPKRSKFLERNRVAASKCRQKKKEWTSNLEVRARDLQSAKNQLTVVVTSLKEEIIFLKGEMLKHSSCGCTAIKDYLNREVASMSQSVYDRGHLPSIVPTVEKSPADDDTVNHTGTVVDDDGTATSPDSTLADLETTSVLSSEHIDRENSTLDELSAGGG